MIPLVIPYPLHLILRVPRSLGCYDRASCIINSIQRVINWTITRAYRRQSKKPSKRGSMYILIIFLFSPPSLLISICLFFDMNTLTLYFYQPTTSRRCGTIHVIDRSAPTCTISHRGGRSSPRVLVRSCSRGTLHTDHHHRFAGPIAKTK